MCYEFLFQGKQHALGDRIQLPEKCAELVCAEGLIAPTSPALDGAASHNITHPEELTLKFHVVHKGSECCVLPFDVLTSKVAKLPKGTMVAEGESKNSSLISSFCLILIFRIYWNEKIQRQAGVLLSWHHVYPTFPENYDNT